VPHQLDGAGLIDVPRVVPTPSTARPKGANTRVRVRSGGLARENDAWAELVFRPATAQLMGAGLANGAQTRDGEQDLEGLFRSLAG
jgi:hypothetical protein